MPNIAAWIRGIKFIQAVVLVAKTMVVSIMFVILIVNRKDQ